MKRVTIFSFALSIGLLTACNNQDKDVKEVSNEQNKISMDNPFLEESKLDFQAPDFSKIKDEHFRPALEEGIRQQLAEIIAIADNEDLPTFENTFVELEKSGRLLARVQGVFGLLASANTNDTLQAIQQDLAPKFAALSDALFLNDNLFNRVKTIHDKVEELELDAESKRLVEYYYQKFVSAGAELSGESKETLKHYNEELASLRTKFSNMLLAASKDGAFVVEDKDLLEGFSEGALATAAEDAKSEGKEGQYLIPLQNTTQQPALTNLKRADVRQELFENAYVRAEKGDKNDTRKIIAEIAMLRAKRAKLLGFDSFAHWSLQDQMAKTPETVEEFFSKLVPAAVAKAKKEATELLVLAKKDNPNATEVNAWDWNYYAEQLRKQKYDLNEDEITPYLELNNVLENGVFFAANQMFGLEFKERHDLPVYHEDVKVYDVIDHDGSQIGLFYSDNFKRSNKGGGAWMSNIVDQSHLLGTKPVIYNVCNFTKPAPGQPVLISWDDVTTLFHEFGHALHGFFANQQYVSLSGTSTPRDFVELPSQLNEHCALDDKILANYAKHYETGKPMPKELVNKIKAASTFNQGYMLTELLAAAELDMQWHTISADLVINDANEFEETSLKKVGLWLESVPPRYRSTYFSHIFGGGYAAGYYAYLWTEMLDYDAFAWFNENGGLTRENGERLREMILSVGNSVDLAENYKQFIGREPSIQPMLKARGMK
ncbi:MAG TPA: M3 family metallopeptidase [Brumimicrobium sp.]|nr:M3 family metallopeptidase [Brumimicrobium sp.]